MRYLGPPSRPTSVPREAAVAAGAAAWLVAAGFGAAPATADDVYLHNGSVFEDVVAEMTPTHVIVDLAIGRLRFPVEQVRDVVRSDSALATFHERRQDLLRDPASPAASWVELAVWGRSHGLERAWRETALFAARLDVGAPELEPLMLEMGYERDAALGWVPREEAMRRRGLVEYRGSWLEPERVSELRRAEREEAASDDSDRAASALRSRSEGASGSPSDNDVALASIELAREVVRSGAERQDTTWPPYPMYYPGWPLAVGGIVHATPEARAAWDALAVRQPGSIIPLKTFQQQLEP
jgi:hypothetical protein